MLVQTILLVITPCRQLSQKLLVIKAKQEDKDVYLRKVVGQMTYEFLSGTGQSNRLFYNDPVAYAMQNSHGVNSARKFFYRKYKNQKDLTSATVTNYDASFGVPGLLRAGLNPVEQFVGRFKVNMWVDGNNLVFPIYNITSFQSLMADIGPHWKRVERQVMGNTYQHYIFTEPIKRP